MLDRIRIQRKYKTSLVRWAPWPHDVSQVSAGRCCDNQGAGIIMECRPYTVPCLAYLGESHKAGVMCTAMDGPCRAVQSALSGAAQLRADGISELLLYTKCTQPSVMTWVTNVSQWPTALHFNSCLVITHLPVRGRDTSFRDSSSKRHFIQKMHHPRSTSSSSIIYWVLRADLHLYW